MKRILFILLLTVPFVGFGQTPVLDEKNGFREIKLGSNINEYSFIKKCEYSDKYFNLKKEFVGNVLWNERLSWDGDHYVDLNKSGYTKLRNWDIKKILLSTHDDLIYEINIIIDSKGNGDGFYYFIEDNFGLPDRSVSKKNHSGPTDKKWMEFWFGDNVTMSLVSLHLNNDKYKLIGWVLGYKDKKLSKKVSDIKKENRQKKKQEVLDNEF